MKKEFALMMFFGLAALLFAAPPAVFCQDDKYDEDEEAIEISREDVERACGTFSVKLPASKPVAGQTAGQAIVYVLRPTSYAGTTQTKLAMDGDWMGTNRANTYFYFAVTPGEHLFCSKAENRSVLRLTLEPDKTYFLQQKMRTGFLVNARNKLALIPEEEGREKIEKLSFPSGDGCGESDREVKFSVKTDKKQHPTPEPATGQALVYVLRRPGMVGAAVQTKLAMDGTWMGANQRNGYFFFNAEPGEHDFCSMAGPNIALLQLEFESDKTYFLEQKIQLSSKAPSVLTLLSEEDGKEMLRKNHFSVFEEKK